MYAVERALLLVLACAALAAAEDDDKKGGDPVKEVAKDLSGALGKGDAAAFKAALARAETIRADHDEKKFAPVLKAIGKGVGHRDPAIAQAAIETLGNLKVPGSAKLLGKLLSPPAKVAEDKRALYQAALAAAGAIHDPQSLKAIEKTVLHPDGEIAAAAARALAGYGELDDKRKDALLERMVGLLEKLEKEAATAKKDEEREAAEKARAALIESLGALTGKSGPTTADEWEKALKEAAEEE